MKRTIGRYEIKEEIGRGGMAIVFKGMDPILERDVAVKVLPPKLVRSKEAVSRFLQEAKLASRLIHPNIVSIYDIGEDVQGVPYIVMEYLDGEMTLWDYMEQKGEPLPVHEAIDLITPICNALHYAHSQNVVHRDIKPENIMITNLNVIKVMDFGLACLEGVHNLTQAGEVFGTLTYFSPEQAQGLHADRRSDLYSVGVIFYQMLTGKLPFEATSIPALIKQHIEARPPSPCQHNPEIPKKIEKVVMKALEKNPEERYQTGEDFLNDLLGKKNSKKGRTGFTGVGWGRLQEEAQRQQIWEGEEEYYGKDEDYFESQEDRFGWDDDEEDGRHKVETPTSSICIECGWENSLDEKYCIACGEVLPQSPKAKSRSPEAKKSSSRRPEKEKKEGPSYASPVVRVPKVSPPPPAKKSPTKEARSHIRKGNEFLNEEKLDFAVIEFEKAIELSSLLTEPYFKLAQIYSRQGKFDKAIKAYQNLLKVDYENPSALRELGILYASQQKIDMALEHLEKAMEKGERDFEIYCLVADLYVEKEEYARAILLLKSAQYMDPEDLQVALELGELFSKQGDTDEAIKQYKTVLEKRPEDEEAWGALGFLYVTMGRDDEAIKCFKKSFDFGNDDPLAHCELGYLYFKKQNYDLAEKEYEQSIFMEPNNVISHYRLGSLYFALEKYDFALEQFTRVIQLDCNHPEGHGKLAYIYYRKDMIDAAMTEYEMAFSLGYNDSHAHNVMGHIYVKKGRIPDSLRHFQASVIGDPLSGKKRKDLGMAYIFLNMHGKAIEELNKVIRLGIDGPDIRRALGVALEAQGDIGKAIKTLSKAIEMEPGAALNYNLRGKCYAQQGMTNLAIREYEKSISLDSRNHLAYTYLAKAYMDKKRYNEAINAYENVVRLVKQFGAGDPKTMAETYCNMGILYTELNNLDLAFKYFQEAMNFDRKMPEVNRGLGEYYLRAGRINDAIKYLERAVIYDPKNARGFASLGKAYEEIRKLNMAIQAYKKAIFLDPKEADHYFLLGSLYFKFGKPDGARQEVMKALRYNHRHSDAEWLLGKIYTGSGKYVEAIERLKKAISYNGQELKYYKSLIDAYYKGNLIDQGFLAIEEYIRNAEDPVLKSELIEYQNVLKRKAEEKSKSSGGLSRVISSFVFKDR